MSGPWISIYIAVVFLFLVLLLAPVEIVPNTPDSSQPTTSEPALQAELVQPETVAPPPALVVPETKEAPVEVDSAMNIDFVRWDQLSHGNRIRCQASDMIGILNGKYLVRLHMPDDMDEETTTAMEEAFWLYSEMYLVTREGMARDLPSDPAYIELDEAIKGLKLRLSEKGIGTAKKPLFFRGSHYMKEE